LKTKEDNIDTYAIRLREIVETVKYKTNSDKVIIVSHSMGGLVARRYIQLFGEGSVDKFIMIGTPNHGIGKSDLSYCKLFGFENECNDMSADSILINKLNNQEIPSVKVYNIIGIGCDSESELSDGVVKNSSAYLPWAKNYYIRGNCTSMEYLHTEIIYPSKYPEIYPLIRKAIRGEI